MRDSLEKVVFEQNPEVDSQRVKGEYYKVSKLDDQIVECVKYIEVNTQEKF